MKTLSLLLALTLLSLPALAYEIGDVVDDFTLTDLEELTVSLSDLDGQIIVLNFFTTWCPGCNVEAAHLEADIWQVYAAEGVTVLAIDVQEPLSLVQGWAAAMGVTYPIWLAPDWTLFQLFPQAMALPYNAVLAPDRSIRYASVGFDLTAITEIIEILIEENQVPVSTTTLGGLKAVYRY